MFNDSPYARFTSLEARYNQSCDKSRCEAQYREFIAQHQLKDLYDRLDALCKHLGLKIEKPGGYTVTKL